MWHEIFGNNNPIHIEIGMGKGHFIRENALRYPHINFIGIEKYSSVIARAIQRMDDYNIPNLKLICFDALIINSVFNKEIDVIYLNFSDPWPKERHARRRLTSDVFLNVYEGLFKGTNKIIMKTDNYDLFNFSKQQFINHDYKIECYNFNRDSMSEDNIMTEYEAKFLNKGNMIYKIDAIK
ncbi:MAG: tRNA (guanosine(46)-N7)-methyltransferase TrmB, partial [Bacilli bacterium]|jgi:tRNA (guanine-N7-)-methyltransferase